MSLGLHITVTNDTEAATIRDAVDRVLGSAPWTEAEPPQGRASSTRRWTKVWRRPGSDGLVIGLFAAHVEQAWAARVQTEIDVTATGASVRVYQQAGNLVAVSLDVTEGG